MWSFAGAANCGQRFAAGANFHDNGGGPASLHERGLRAGCKVRHGEAVAFAIQGHLMSGSANARRIEAVSEKFAFRCIRPTGGSMRNATPGASNTQKHEKCACRN
jgi:hypothetical protein